MIHTLDFITDLIWDKELRGRLLAWLETPGAEAVEAGAFRLEWVPETDEVQIALWDQSYPFRWKCPDYRCPAGELAGLIRARCREADGASSIDTL